MKRERAFTLVELLVALAITAVLVVILANVVSATLGAWRQGRNRLDTFSNARQLIGRIADEISGAIAEKGRMEFVENASELKGATDPSPKTAENLFFIAPYPNSGSGDLCVIMYRLDAVNHRLERRFEDSASAWGVQDAADRYNVSGYPDTTPTKWRPIADGVMEFEIRSYSQDDLDNNKTPTDSWSSRTVGSATEGKTPRRVVLRIKVVDDRTLTRLAGNATQALKENAREFFAEFSLPSS
jgi:prepilin-type N-terminal cleavage/methylation domain-containing protein